MTKPENEKPENETRATALQQIDNGSVRLALQKEFGRGVVEELMAMLHAGVEITEEK